MTSLNNNNISSDPFWSTQYSILFQKNRFIEFFPTYQMTMIEKLNAIMRLGIYIGLVLAFVSRNYLYLYIPIIIGVITYFIYNNQLENFELYFNNNEQHNDEIKNELDNKNCTQPTKNNPFMNFNIITDKRDRPKACDSWDDKNVKQQINDNFNHNLYRDVSDLYGKKNSQRQYYTMPSTSMPNDQTAFAKWCYNTGPTCKERTLYCAPIYSPVKDTSDAYKYVPKEF